MAACKLSAVVLAVVVLCGVVVGDTVPMLGWSTDASSSIAGCASLPDAVTVAINGLQTSDNGVAAWFIYDKLSISDLTKKGNVFGSDGVNHFARLQASMNAAPQQIQQSVDAISDEPVAMARNMAASNVAVVEMSVEELKEAKFSSPTFVIVHLYASKLADNDALIDGAVSAISQQGNKITVLVSAHTSGAKSPIRRSRRMADLINKPFGADSVDQPQKMYIYFNGTIFMGLMSMALIVLFILVGSYGILMTQTQDRFSDSTDKPLIVPN